MFSWLVRKPLLDDTTVEWLFDLYTWSLRHFEAGVFYPHTRLVTPDEGCFPGRADSPQAMAELIFGHVRRHAALAHWPCRVVPNHLKLEVNRVLLDGPLRQVDGEEPVGVEEGQRLMIGYVPDMVRNPEALIASFAHQLAHYLATLAPEPPPGGKENWPHATEVLAVFLGFGVLLANSAGNVRIARCGACAPPPVDRQAWLSQHDISYALAIFCVLKGIPARQACAQLKPSLRGWLRRAIKAVQQHPRLAGLTESPGR